MFDPITLVAGGVLLAGGWLAGRIRTESAPKRQVAATICSCEHGFGTHDAGGACKAQIKRADRWDDYSNARHWEWVACPCLTYDGPEPLPRVWTGA